MNRLCKILLAAALSISLHSITLAQIFAFRSRPERIPVGTVYHYLKTNIDGTKPETVSIYVSSRDRIESFKYHEKGTRAGLVMADMDWKTFSARRLESWQVYSNEDRRLFGTLEFDPGKAALNVRIPAVKPETESVPVPFAPFHLYNFDLASLNVAFSQLAHPERPFVVGIIDPTFRTDAPLIVYKGEMNVAFERNEMRNGRKCRRYAASGPGIGGRGTIWVTRERPIIQDMEFDVPDNPEWDTFKLKLVSVEKMTRSDWGKLIASRF